MGSIPRRPADRPFEGRSRELFAGEPDLLAALKAAANPLGDQMARVVQARVAAFAGPEAGKRHWLIVLAASAAIGQFFEQIEGGQASSSRVDDLFAKMGYGEATDGHSLAPILEALAHAHRLAWDETRTLVVRMDGAAVVLSALHDELEWMHLRMQDQVERGYQTAQRIIARNQGGPERDLVQGLLAGTVPDQLAELARAAGWDLPAEVVVASIEGEPEPTTLAGVLTDLVAGDLLAFAGVSDRGRIMETLSSDPGVRRAAVSWPVSPGHVADARRWVVRALELADQGVLPDVRIVDCDEHRIQLWLHAEPRLRQQLCQELLGPLLAEGPNSRQILAETLSAWLEIRGSAPALAVRLDVHPQTIRYRWKRINQLLGDALQDPELIVQLTMLLKASVPLWNAGDQSDFPSRDEPGEK